MKETNEETESYRGESLSGQAVSDRRSYCQNYENEENADAQPID